MLAQICQYALATAYLICGQPLPEQQAFRAWQGVVYRWDRDPSEQNLVTRAFIVKQGEAVKALPPNQP